MPHLQSPAPECIVDIAKYEFMDSAVSKAETSSTQQRHRAGNTEWGKISGSGNQRRIFILLSNAFIHADYRPIVLLHLTSVKFDPV